MEFIEDINGIDKNKLKEFIFTALKEAEPAKKVLVIIPDYTREDFTDQIVPAILESLREKGVLKIDFLNAGGTHRKMTEDEFLKKVGLSCKETHINFYNHQFDDPSRLEVIGYISADWVAKKTSGLLNCKIPVSVNKMIFEDYGLIIAISSTVPHEAAGYSGGVKIFFPGLAGPQVINMFHWVAALIGIPNLVGKVDNSARDVINKGAALIFNKIKPRVFSFNMVNRAENNKVTPLGFYIDNGLEGFINAYRRASLFSAKVLIKYIKRPLRQVVQVIPSCYDEIWLAGKGSYKLQRTGVLKEGGEIIILAPHIDRFHSNKKIESEILKVGYHCRDYILKLFKKGVIKDTNVAAHLINLAGPGEYNPETGREKLKFRVTLATGISKKICESVGLGYRDPQTVNSKDFTCQDCLWIGEGGKYFYVLANNKKNEEA